MFDIVVKASSSSCESIVISFCPRDSQCSLAEYQFAAVYEPVILPMNPMKRIQGMPHNTEAGIGVNSAFLQCIGKADPTFSEGRPAPSEDRSRSEGRTPSDGRTPQKEDTPQKSDPESTSGQYASYGNAYLLQIFSY